MVGRRAMTGRLVGDEGVSCQDFVWIVLGSVAGLEHPVYGRQAGIKFGAECGESGGKDISSFKEVCGDWDKIREK